MRKTFKQIFLLRKSKSDKPGQATIYLRITMDRARTEFSLQRQCDPTKWIPNKGRLIGTNEQTRSLNNFLSSVQFSIYEIFQEFLASRTAFDGEKIKARFLGLDTEQPKMLLEIYETHNQEFEAVVGKGLSHRTLQKYKTIKNYVSQFISIRYHVADLELQRIDFAFVKGFEIYLKSKKGCSHNTAMDYLKKVKKIMNQCIAKNWIARSPFVGFKMTSTPTTKIILTENELNAMASKQISIPRVEIVRDVFLFSCYTGLAYCDVAKLNRHNLVVGFDGENWISTVRSKTKLLPVISNQKINSYLKEVADLCGIKKELTFHCARHTFATTVTLTNGVPIEDDGAQEPSDHPALRKNN